MEAPKHYSDIQQMVRNLVKNYKPITSHTIKIHMNILPDRTLDSLQILDYEIIVANLKELKTKLLELFNEINIKYYILNCHFSMINDNKADNPTLAAYSYSTYTIEIMNEFQLDILLLNAYSEIYIVYR